MEAGPCDSVDADCDSVGRLLALPAPSKQSRGGGGFLTVATYVRLACGYGSPSVLILCELAS